MCKAITLATFKMSGNIPRVKEALIILQRGITMMSATSFRSRRGMLAGPELFSGRALIISKISSSEMWAIIRLNWLRFLRNFDGDMLGTVGMLLSVSGPTLTMKLLKLYYLRDKSS